MRRLESLAADAPTLHAYLQEIARFPALDVVEEGVLASRVEQRDERAIARLVEAHLGLVVRYARRYRDLGVPLLDLVHDGNLALIDAARRFDPKRHGRFGTYALWWVRQGLFHRVSLAPSPGGGPRTADTRAGHVSQALRAALDHVAAAADDELTAADVRLLDSQWRRAPRGRGRPDDEGLELEELEPPLVDDSDDNVLRLALIADLETSLLELDPKERRVLALRLGLDDGEPRSLDQIGDRLQVSPARVERLSLRAIRKLRRQRSVRSGLN